MLPFSLSLPVPLRFSWEAAGVRSNAEAPVWEGEPVESIAARFLQTYHFK